MLQFIFYLLFPHLYKQPVNCTMESFFFLLIFTCLELSTGYSTLSFNSFTSLLSSQLNYDLSLDWKKHKLKSRLPGEISITSDMQMTTCLVCSITLNVLYGSLSSRYPYHLHFIEFEQKRLSQSGQVIF